MDVGFCHSRNWFRTSLILTAGILFVIALCGPVTALNWQSEQIASSTGMGGFTNAGSPPHIVIDSSGKMHVAYTLSEYMSDGWHYNLYYATKDASGWHTTYLGQYVFHDLVLDSSGKPHIIALDMNNHPINAYFSGSQWVFEDLYNDIGQVNILSAAIDSHDHIHILGLYGNVYALYYRHQEVSNGNIIWTSEKLNPGQNDLIYSSALTLDSLDNPHVIYEYNYVGVDDKFHTAYTEKDSNGWHQVDLLTGSASSYLSIALDNSGNPHVCYAAGTITSDLSYEYRDGTGSWHREIITQTTGSADMALDQSGNPHVTYGGFDTSFFNSYGYRDNSGWHIENFAPITTADYPTQSSLALDSSGNPHIINPMPVAGGQDLLYFTGKPSPVLTTITVSPLTKTLNPGQTQQFTAACFDQNNNAMADCVPSWSTDNSAVGTIDSTGLFTAVGAGTTPVKATSGSVTGTAKVNVETILTGSSVTSSENPSTYGQSITFTAMVTPGAATGTITFMEGTTTLGSGTLSGGTATYGTSSLAVGSHSITAVYGGDIVYAGSTSSVLTQIVNPIQTPTTTAVKSSANPSTYNKSVTFTVTVIPKVSTGTVTFIDGATTLGTGIITSGIAKYSTSMLNAGTHAVTAVYSGDTTNAGSSSTVLSQVVSQAPTSIKIKSSANPLTWGKPVTFTATVTPKAATGSITFFDGTSTLGTGTLSGGVATYTTTSLNVGSHSITAVYSGDANCFGNTSPVLGQDVKLVTTTIKVRSSANPSKFSNSVTFTATVTPATSTGTVTFMDGTTTLGVGTLSGGAATYSTPSLAVGSHSITAVYGGDTNNAVSSSVALTHVVNMMPTTIKLISSVNPSTSGQSVILTATVTPTAATGIVTFMDGTTTIGTGTLSGGAATYSTSSFSSGTHSITAVYNLDGNYAGSTSKALSLKVK
jgi:hypothetical protein